MSEDWQVPASKALVKPERVDEVVALRRAPWLCTRCQGFYTQGRTCPRCGEGAHLIDLRDERANEMVRDVCEAQRHTRRTRWIAGNAILFFVGFIAISAIHYVGKAGGLWGIASFQMGDFFVVANIVWSAVCVLVTAVSWGAMEVFAPSGLLEYKVEARARLEYEEP